MKTLDSTRALALLAAVAMGGLLMASGCGGPAQAGKLEVTYYYLPG